jgi:hypothetical protein
MKACLMIVLFTLPTPLNILDTPIIGLGDGQRMRKQRKSVPIIQNVLLGRVEHSSRGVKST